LYAFLFLRHGVTGIRIAADAGGGASLETRAAVERGDFAGPRIASCGPFIDGPGAKFASAEVVTTREEARAAVARAAAAGYDCVKAYNELDAETLGGVRDEAAKQGLPVIGHVPYRLTLEEARLDDVQHMFGFHPRVDADSFRSIDGWFEVGDERVDEVIAFLTREGAAMTTSLVAGRRIARSRQSALDPDDPMRRWLPPWYADAIWRIPGGINPGNLLSEERLATLDRTIAHQSRIVPRLYRAGVDLRAGTDCFAPPVVPGASLQQELAIFVEGGLTPEEALAIATRGSARALPVPGLGRLEPGAPADLLIFAKDPTVDLAHLDSLLAVVKAGRIYPRDVLDRQEARYRAHFDGFLQRRVVTPLLRAALGAVIAATFTPDAEGMADDAAP
ncbi:MAG: amidohydrolase family protein, partial [Myxococcota bacterium]